MRGVDDDASRWIGGLVIDAAHQRHGVARAAVTEAIRLLIARRPIRSRARRVFSPPIAHRAAGITAPSKTQAADIDKHDRSCRIECV